MKASCDRSLDEERMYLQYQPRVDLYSGRIVGMEALLRFLDLKQANLSPGRSFRSPKTPD